MKEMVYKRREDFVGIGEQKVEWEMTARRRFSKEVEVRYQLAVKRGQNESYNALQFTRFRCQSTPFSCHHLSRGVHYNVCKSVYLSVCGCICVL